MGDSATGGYIPAVGGNGYDDVLEDEIQTMISGITGLEGHYVRPRWQPEPPPMPSIGTNWCAFGITRITPDDGPYFAQYQDDANVMRHETIEVAVSFYGAQGQQFGHVLRDGLTIWQNTSALQNMRFIECGELISIPDFLNQQFVHRFDMRVIFRRKTSRNYAVKSLLGFTAIEIIKN